MVNQAVILCGGLGKRLMPLTKHTPKPMVMINKKPFLEYLIYQLKSNGLTNILGVIIHDHIWYFIHQNYVFFFVCLFD